MELTYKLEDLPLVANKILQQALENNKNVFAFYGEMGAGKTTLIKEICSQLGVMDTVQSPTFAIINQYQTERGEPVFHFDFYRLDDLKDALNIGTEEILYSGEICLIEWPELVEPILPESTINIKISQIDALTRKLEIE